MPRKKVNGNIIGARWQDIRHCREIIAVNRRIGGLENIVPVSVHKTSVNRRIGGLENEQSYTAYGQPVNRRIGGLETKGLL